MDQYQLRPGPLTVNFLVGGKVVFLTLADPLASVRERMALDGAICSKEQNGLFFDGKAYRAYPPSSSEGGGGRRLLGADEASGEALLVAIAREEEGLDPDLDYEMVGRKLVRALRKCGAIHLSWGPEEVEANLDFLLAESSATQPCGCSAVCLHGLTNCSSCEYADGHAMACPQHPHYGATSKERR